MTDNFSTTDRQKCPICSGTGFDRTGHICVCITRPKEKDNLDDNEALESLKDLFGF
jgi:hypothetical protein